MFSMSSINHINFKFYNLVVKWIIPVKISYTYTEDNKITIISLQHQLTTEYLDIQQLSTVLGTCGNQSFICLHYKINYIIKHSK